MKKIILVLSIFVFISCGSSEPNPCLMSEDFIKQDLTFPDEAEFSSLDCTSEMNVDGSYTILRKISGKNAFGVQSSYIYKVTLSYNGGITTDINNWTLINIRSEKYQ